MKWSDIILIGGALVGGYFISQALNPKKAGNESLFKTDQGLQTFFDKGGEVTTENKAGFPWYSGFFGGLGILGGLLEGYTGGDTTTYDGGGDKSPTGGDDSNTKSYSGLKTGRNTTAMRPYGYYRTSPKKTIDKIKEVVNPKANVNVAAKIIKDIPHTITEEPGVFQPMTVARLTSRAQYGTFGGR